MVDAKLIDYIRISLSEGTPIDQVKKNLSAKGWSDANINEAIGAATQNQTPRIQPQPQPQPRPQQLPAMPLITTKPSSSNTQTKKSPGIKISKNMIFISLGVFAFILIIILIFSLAGGSNISESQLTQGKVVSLAQNGQVKFNLDNADHSLTVNSISGDSASITLQSTPITTTLNVGDIKDFALNNSATYDLEVTLENITNNKANFYLQEISEPCVENWSCADWSNCINEKQTRTCTDSNSCGTTTTEPILTQACTPTCSSQNGYLCNSTEMCPSEGTVLNASDANSSGVTCCSENCTLSETCSQLNGYLCTSGETCGANNLSASDAINGATCCSAACTLQTCSELNGYICTTGETCGATLLNASDANSSGVTCCSENCTLSETCSQLNGYLCTSGETCGANNLSASDAINGATCCSAACTLQTCSELNGYICTTGETCGATLLNASDTATCCSSACTLQTCAEQGGSVCNSTSTCPSNDLLNASDTSSCCSSAADCA